MEVAENESYTKDYFDADKRYIGNAIQVFFNDGTSTDRVAVDYPIGHRQRRDEGIPVLKKKFETSISAKLKDGQWSALSESCADRDKLNTMPVDDFMDEEDLHTDISCFRTSGSGCVCGGARRALNKQWQSRHGRHSGDSKRDCRQPESLPERALRQLPGLDR
jgi:hypothetical protein